MATLICFVHFPQVLRHELVYHLVFLRFITRKERAPHLFFPPAMSELILPKAAELRQMQLPQILALLGKVEHADRLLANEPPDSPARKKNAFVRRRLLHLCGENSQFETNPDYFATEERIQYEEERLRARERGEEEQWMEEQFRKNWPSFEHWPPTNMTEEEYEDELAKSEALVNSLQALDSTKAKRLNPIRRLVQADQALADPAVEAKITQISKSIATAAEESTERVGIKGPPMRTKSVNVKRAKKATKKKKAAAKVSPISAAPYFFYVPGPVFLTPRDFKDIQHTDDYLFIAVLIERSRLSGWLNGERPPEISPNHYSAKNLRKILVRKRNFWILRTFLQNPVAPPSTIKIDGRTICSEGKWHNTAFIKRLSSLRHPIAMGQPDELLANLHAQRFYSWCDITQPEPCTLTGQPPEAPKLPPNTPNNQKKRDRMLSKWRDSEGTNVHLQLICPLDGPVIPISVGIATPTSTWKDLCGRAYASLHCPHCLARLHSKLAFKN